MAGPSGATARLALPYPTPDDTVDVPRDVKALADKLDANASLAGTLAARPAAGIVGRFYYATDTQEQWYDTGAAWVFVGGTDLSGMLIGTGSYLLGSSWQMIAGTNLHLPGLARGQVVDLTFSIRLDIGTAQNFAQAFLIAQPLNATGITPPMTSYVLAPRMEAGTNGVPNSISETGSQSLRYVVRAGQDGEHRFALYVTGGGGGNPGAAANAAYCSLVYRVRRDRNLTEGPIEATNVPIP